MKTDNDIYWFHLDKDTVCVKSSIQAVLHDKDAKKWVFRYAGTAREYPEKEGKAIAARLGIKP